MSGVGRLGSGEYGSQENRNWREGVGKDEGGMMKEEGDHCKRPTVFWLWRLISDPHPFSVHCSPSHPFSFNV